jgi:large subunit ribosomal protein L13
MPQNSVIKPQEVEKKWLLIDANGIALGRLASEIATILQAKNKPEYSPQWDLSDHVIVVNAQKVMLTGNKAKTEIHYRHTGYPGGIKQETIGQMKERSPYELIRKAVKGMLPKNKLAADRLKKLHVYVGEEHPHTGQQPQAITVGN